MKIAFITSECAPFASTGGLGEVSGALPPALAARGNQVIVIMPLYGQAARHAQTPADTGIRLDIPVGLQHRRAEIHRGRLDGVDVYFVGRDEYFDRRSLYGLPHREYDDNFERFVFFQKAAVELIDHLAFQPDVVHANDWQTGLVPSFLRHGIHGVGRTPRGEHTLFTIHNLAYQGIFPAAEFSATNLPYSSYSIEGMEYYGQVSCMKAGIVTADWVSTVSRTYAREIQTEPQGYGLHGVLAERNGRISGIINGIDYTVWNPETDPEIPVRYTAETVREGKTACRQALCRTMELPMDPERLLIGMVTRLVELKGIGLLANAIKALMERDVQLVLLGSGNAEYHDLARQWAATWPDRFACALVYDPVLAHGIYAGADAFLMPSQTEPCGLGQLYSMRYGTLPLVHATGGLADTVLDLSEDPTHGSGFRLPQYSPDGLLDAVDRAVTLHKQPHAFDLARQQIMRINHSWEHAATEYLDLYQHLLE
jgi:starch synthase